MFVHPVVVPGSGTRSWTVLGDDDVPVVPVDRFLAYLTDIGRSPNTALHLTWQDNSNDEAAFEVDNTVERRDAPAHSGTGTVTYTWTGLKPDSRTCFRIRASNYDTFSNWDPITGYVCATSSNPAASPCVFLTQKQVDCTSSNPKITLDAANGGDTSGCTFSAQITWGDGTQQTVQYQGANNQPSFVANHTYQQKGTFSISLTQTVLSGGCTTYNDSYKFTHS